MHQRNLLQKVFSLLYGLFFLTALLFASCTGSGTDLSLVETLLETNPAAADSILTNLPMPTRHRERAWYAVLKTQLDYKQYKPITSDSLILTATDYYGIHRKSYRSAMAWYSQGCVYMVLQNDTSAVESFIRAFDLFPDTLNRYCTLAEMCLGDLYLRKAMYNQAYNMYTRCKKNAELISDSAIISYCDYKIATIYLYEKKYSLAKPLFARLKNDLNLSDFYRNESIISYCKTVLYGDKDIQSAYDILSNNPQIESNNTKGVIFSILGIIHYSLCNYDLAYDYFKKSLESDNEIYTRGIDYCYLLELSSLMGDADRAHSYSRCYTNIIDSIMAIENANDIASVKISYVQETYNLKRKEYIIRSVIILIAVLIVLIMLVMVIYQYKKRKYQEYYIRLSDQYRVRKMGLKPGSNESEILDYCLQMFYSTPSYDLLKQESCIITAPLRQSILHDLTVSFSEYYSYAMINYPDLNTNYINYCILYFLNFSHQQIIDILCMSENNYRVSKSRIRKILDPSNRLYPR